MHVSERFAQLPPGSGDMYFVYVQLLDANRMPLASWGRDGPGAYWQFATDVEPQCAAGCFLANNQSVWATQAFSFAGYGAGVRYVRWKDGGRDAEAFAGRHGAVLASPSLTVATAAPGECGLQCVHGACGPGGGCQCEAGWEGALCAIHSRVARPAVCSWTEGPDCSGHGQCIGASRTAQSFSFCRCEPGFVGTYCSTPTDDIAGPSCGGTAAGGASAYRRGVFASVDAAYDVSTQVVSDGLVEAQWRGGTKAPPPEPRPRANGTSFFVWLVDEDATEAVQLGAPQLVPRDPSRVGGKVELISTRFSGLELLAEWMPQLLQPPVLEERDEQLLQLWHGAEPLQLHVEYECHAAGEVVVELEVPVPGFCPLRLAWRHTCEGNGLALGTWLPWVVLLLCGGCLCVGCRRYGWWRRVGEVVGVHHSPGMLGPAREVPLGGLQELKYAAYSAWSRVRLAKEELKDGGLVGASAVLFRGSTRQHDSMMTAGFDEDDDMDGGMRHSMHAMNSMQLSGGLEMREPQTRTRLDDDKDEML